MLCIGNCSPPQGGEGLGVRLQIATYSEKTANGNMLCSGYSPNEWRLYSHFEYILFGSFRYIVWFYQFTVMKFGQQSRILQSKSDIALCHHAPVSRLLPFKIWCWQPHPLPLPTLGRGERMYSSVFYWGNFCDTVNDIRIPQK